MKTAGLSNVASIFSATRRKRPFGNWENYILQTGRISAALAVLCLMMAVSPWFSAPDAFAAEEVCGSCGYRVSVSGEFSHLKAGTSDKIEGGTGDVYSFYEEINGDEFSIKIGRASCRERV